MRNHNSWRRTTIAVFVLFLMATGLAENATAQPPGRQVSKLRKHKLQRAQLLNDYAVTIEKIARARDAVNRQEAAAIRKMAVDAAASSRSLQPLPSAVQPDIPLTLPENERFWRLELRKANRDYANRLFRRAQMSMRDGLASYAYGLIRDVVRTNPDQVAARKLLGFVRDGEKWSTPFAKRQRIRGHVWDRKYGWLPKAHVARYHAGERYYKPRGKRGGWVTVARDTAQHASFTNPWIIQTEHYEVRTNHSLERGVEVAQRLEDYYRFFFRTFAGFFNSREQMKNLFGGTSSRRSRSTKRYLVNYFKNKAEYVVKLRPKIPQIAITNGLYLTDTRTAYFFHDPNVDNNHTLYHEATHQIFYESLSKPRYIAHKDHFWIIEGIACYMESFKHENGKISLGDPLYPRFAAAKYRYVKSKYYVPLSQFARMGMQRFQTHPKIQMNYSQASGQAMFFMDYDGGRYRDALIEHLSQLYRAGTKRFVRVQSLDVLTGVAYSQLDKQYGTFISNLPTKKPLPAGR